MRSILLFGLLALAPLASAAAPATASTAPATAATAATMSAPDCRDIPTLPPPSKTFTVGTLRVQRYGDHGRPVILIPGLGSGSWVWAETVRHLQVGHVVYALTLAGFDGVPAPEKMTGLLDQADGSLLKLIQQHPIDHPVLIGHSLGGTLAIRFAGEHSDLLSGVVAVDGLPVFPGTEDQTPAQRQDHAAKMRARSQSGTMTNKQFAAMQTRFMQRMGLANPSPGEAACYGNLQARSSQAAFMEYAAEDFAADYRPLVKHINVPLLEISPYYKPDAKMTTARTGKPVMTPKARAAYYRKLLAGDPTARVTVIKPARHFVMLAQPRKFMQVLDRFLANLPDGDKQ